MITAREFLLRVATARLNKYRKYMVCKNNYHAGSGVEIPKRAKISISGVMPLLMAWGFNLERALDDRVIYSRLNKPLRVYEADEIIGWLEAKETLVSVPAPEHAPLFDCDVNLNIIYEVLAPKLNNAEKIVRDSISIVSPDIEYVSSYSEQITAIKSILEGSKKAKIYVLSKFAQPGYIMKFIKELSSIPEVSLYLAVEENKVTRAIKEKTALIDNVRIVTTRSHRKLLLVLFQMNDNSWGALGYRGSMNIFFPGVDDYMEAIRDYRELQRLIHGLIRAFLII